MRPDAPGRAGRPAPAGRAAGRSRWPIGGGGGASAGHAARRRGARRAACGAGAAGCGVAPASLLFDRVAQFGDLAAMLAVGGVERARRAGAIRRAAPGRCRGLPSLVRPLRSAMACSMLARRWSKPESSTRPCSLATLSSSRAMAPPVCASFSPKRAFSTSERLAQSRSAPARRRHPSRSCVTRSSTASR